MSYFDYEFEAAIDLLGIGKSRVVTYRVLFLPPPFEQRLPFDRYPRLRVEGEIDEAPVRGAWIPVGDGRRYLIVSPDVRRAIGKDVGDTVQFRFRIDDQDHVDVPFALSAAIQADEDVLEKWERLSAGKKRMFAIHVSKAKADQTIQRRIDEALAALRLGCSLRDLKSAKKK